MNKNQYDEEPTNKNQYTAYDEEQAQLEELRKKIERGLVERAVEELETENEAKEEQRKALQDAIDAGEIRQGPILPSPMHSLFRPSLLYAGGTIREPAFEGDSGYDLIVAHQTWIGANAFATVPLEAKIAIPSGYWGLVVARSGTNMQGRMLVLPGVIDSGYRGPLYAFVYNMTDEKIILLEGFSICQLMLVPSFTPPAVKCDELPSSKRGECGFGSTGLNRKTGTVRKVK